MNFEAWLDAIKNLPQTQKDLRAVAKTVETVQDPKTQAMLRQTQEEMQQYAYITLGLQALSTVAIFGLLMVTLRRR